MEHGGLGGRVLLDDVVSLLEVVLEDLEVGQLAQRLDVDGQHDLRLELALLGVVHRHLALLQEGQLLRQLLHLALDQLRDQLDQVQHLCTSVLLHLPVLVGPGTLETDRSLVFNAQSTAKVIILSGRSPWRREGKKGDNWFVVRCMPKCFEKKKKKMEGIGSCVSSKHAS